LTLKDGQTVVGTVMITGDGKFELSTRETGTVAVAKDPVVAIRNDTEQAAYDAPVDRLRHPHLTDFWSALLDTGLSLTRGNSSTLAYTLSTKAVRTTTADKISVYTTQIYASDNTIVPGRTIANAIRGGVRGDVNIGPRWFVFAFTDFEHDAFQGLDLRNVLGGGLGYHLIKTKDTTLDLSGGGDFDQEYFAATALTPGLTRKTAEIVAGEQLSIKLNDRLSLSETFNFFPNMSSRGDFRYQLDATAATKLKSWMSWQITYSARYLTNPLPGFKNNDVLLSTGLRLTAGKGVF
jgi:putative salt-induced outer membrane protein YdiY